jgi:hypothetical protein
VGSIGSCALETGRSTVADLVMDGERQLPI